MLATIPLGGAPEELVPAAATLQAKGVLEGMAELVAQDPQALAASAALDLEHLLALQPPQTRVGEVKRDRNARNAGRREPLLRKPDVRTESQAAPFELGVDLLHGVLQPGTLDR